jgi:hypothetical protein
LAAVARAAIGSPDAACDPAASDGLAPVEAASDAAACDAAALLGDDAPPDVQADATIASIASGVAIRRNECFVVKSDLLGREDIPQGNVAPPARTPTRSLSSYGDRVGRDGGRALRARPLTFARI